MNIENTFATVIMATRNKAQYLDLTLASLERQSVPSSCWEVVVTDDASEDNTVEILQRYADRNLIRIKWVTAEANRGRSGARNDALALAQGDTIVFLDDDRIVPSDFLFWHLVHHKQQPIIVIGDTGQYIHSHVGKEIDKPLWHYLSAIEPDRKNNPERVEQILFPNDLDDQEKLGNLAFRAGDWSFAVNKMDAEGVPYPDPWVFFTTGNASAPRASISAIGGFDEEYVGWGLEDNDLCIRLMKLGLGFKYEHRATTFHQTHASSPQKMDEYRLNFDRFMEKFPEADTVDNRLLCRGVFELRTWIDACKQGKRGRTVTPCRPTDRNGNQHIAWCVGPNNLGAALRGAALYDELRRTSHEIKVTWITTGTSAQWLMDRGYTVHDSGAPDSRSRFNAYTSYFKENQPNLVIGDEDLLALPVAHSAAIPSLYITSYLVSERDEPDFSYTRYARQILVPDVPGSFLPPSEYFARVDFCGPWIVPNSETDSQLWRSLLCDKDSKLIIVNLSSRDKSTEEFAVKCTEALASQNMGVKVAIYSDTPLGKLKQKLKPEVLVFEALSQRMNVLSSADLVLTSCDPCLLLELAACGVPVLVAADLGSKDTYRADMVKRMSKHPNVLAVVEHGADAEQFENSLKDAICTGLSRRHSSLDFAESLRIGAETLLKYAL